MTRDFFRALVIVLAMLLVIAEVERLDDAALAAHQAQ